MPKPKIYVAGHRGMVGSALVRHLEKNGAGTILTKTHDALDLCNQAQVQAFFAKEKPDQVYLAAAKVGGIYANNTYPAEFIYNNLMMQANVIHAAHQNNVQKLLFLGSSCIYPKAAPQPMSEDVLLTGPLESTNEPYAIAKIAGIKLCESYNRQYGRDYRSVMPTNLYGPGDNYHLENSHVLPAMIRKFHLAKLAQAKDWSGIVADEKRYGPIPNEVCDMLAINPTRDGLMKTPTVTLWGSGTPYREFLHVDDLARACAFVMNLDSNVYQQQITPMQSHLNIGSGSDLTILDLAKLAAKVVGYQGEINFDSTKPDGTMRKLMDSERINRLGWHSQISLEKGIQMAYESYCLINNDL